MFSFFRKPEAPKRAASALLDRVNALRSVKLPFFQSLLELTDQVSDQVVDQYEPFGKFDLLEVYGFCASIVTTAIAVVDLPENEKPVIMDIYLGLWVDSVVQNGRGVNGPALKDQIVRLWAEYRPFIIGTETEPVQYIIYKSGSAAMRLVSNVDRLAGVTRDLTQQQIVATRFKSLISEAARIVDELTSSSFEIEQLEERRADLTKALEAAQSKQKAKT